MYSVYPKATELKRQVSPLNESLTAPLNESLTANEVSPLNESLTANEASSLNGKPSGIDRD
jgi:hypothetical protein